jgi:hypothetical protein
MEEREFQQENLSKFRLNVTRKRAQGGLVPACKGVQHTGLKTLFQDDINDGDPNSSSQMLIVLRNAPTIIIAVP